MPEIKVPLVGHSKVVLEKFIGDKKPGDMPREVIEARDGVEMFRGSAEAYKEYQTTTEGFWCQNCSSVLCDKQGNICPACQTLLKEVKQHG